MVVRLGFGIPELDLLAVSFWDMVEAVCVFDFAVYVCLTEFMFLDFVHLLMFCFGVSMVSEILGCFWNVALPELVLNCHLVVASAAARRLVVSRRFNCFSVVPRHGGWGGGKVGIHCAAGECISVSCRLFSSC